MCLVVYKPAGAIILKRAMQVSWDNNPDGAGFMLLGKRKVIGYKGYMTLESLYAGLEMFGAVDAGGNIVGDLSIAIHFRWATHGGVSKEKCHPFPASNKVDDLNALTWRADYGIAHNGIIEAYARKGLSDSQGFIKDVLSNKEILASIEDDRVSFLLSRMMGSSKFIVMSQEKIYLLGGWIQTDGVYYSNTSYKTEYISTVVSKYSASTWGNCKRCGFTEELLDDGLCTYCAEEDEDSNEMDSGYIGVCDICETRDKVIVEQGLCLCSKCYEWHFNSSTGDKYAVGYA